MEATLGEKLGIKGHAPIDLDAAGLTGTRINLAKAERIGILVSVANAADDVVVSLLQHDAETAGNSKALSLPIESVYYVKAGAATLFTKKELAAAASTITETDLNGAAGLLLIEVKAEHLDVNNNFAWVSANIAATTGLLARLGDMTYLLHDLKSLPGYDQSL